MDFWDQFLATAWGALAGVVVGGGISALIAWRTFRAERKARAEERAAEAIAAGRDRARAHVEGVIELLSDMMGFIPTTRDTVAARGVAQRFALRVAVLATDLSDLDRKRFFMWQLNAHESFLAMVDWEGDDRGPRSRTDEFASVVALATEQLQQWFRGEATTRELMLAGDEARARFLPQWTDAEIDEIGG